MWPEEQSVLVGNQDSLSRDAAMLAGIGCEQLLSFFFPRPHSILRSAMALINFEDSTAFAGPDPRVRCEE